MEQRKIRIGAIDTEVSFEGRVGEVVDISLSGALLELDEGVPLGSQSQIVFRKGSDTLELTARVVRQTAPRLHLSKSTVWQVAVEFVDMPSEARKAIPRLIGPTRH